MPLDALFLTSLVGELTEAVIGSRIDKIHQPARDEMIFTLRGGQGGQRLLLSASPIRPRAHLTQHAGENPAEPPMFCMLLRKHLTGGRILEIEQPPMERLLIFHIEAADELGDRTVKKLILEAMGRHSNLILLDREGRILDCIRRVDQDMSAQRQILPGLFYRLPSPQEKWNPIQLLLERSNEQLFYKIEKEKPLDQVLLDSFGGISPLIAREIAFEATGTSDGQVDDHWSEALSRLERLIKFVDEGQTVPYLLLREGKPVDFSFRPILQYGPSTELVQMESFSQLLDSFYSQRESAERIRQKGQELIRSVTTARDRTRRKLSLQEKELSATKNREQLRQKGDLITSNLHQMQKGMTQLRTINYYDPDGSEVTIQLDPLRTPQQNAARYYKDYNRAKTAEQMLTEQMEKGRGELEYLESVLESLSRAEGERDLEEIRQEMEAQGYVRRRAKAKQRMKRPASKPIACRSSAGLRILVGRNNSQNDELTMRQADRGDLWFHAQKIHGAHVILETEGKTADPQSMAEAAALAAWFSQGRDGGKIPVDCTQVRYVKKPAGAKPGMVIYTNYETIMAMSEDAMIKSLLEQ